jgi:hypothetical protein
VERTSAAYNKANKLDPALKAAVKVQGVDAAAGTGTSAERETLSEAARSKRTADKAISDAAALAKSLVAAAWQL